MSRIQRYHTNEYGDLVKSNASYAKLCKYKDVKDLEAQLAEAREDIYKFSEIALMQGEDEFGHSWEDFKFYVLDEQLKEKGE